MEKSQWYVNRNINISTVGKIGDSRVKMKAAHGGRVWGERKVKREEKEMG